MNWWNPFDWGEMMVEGAKNKVAQIIKEIAEDFIMSSYWICLISRRHQHIYQYFYLDIKKVKILQ